MMETHNFTVVLEKPRAISAELEEAVFGVGCDDAALCERDGVVYLDFDREAATLDSAITSALSDLFSVDGVRVSHVGPEDLVTPAEVARRAGVSREAVRLWVSGSRGPGGFPVPIAGVDKQTRVWRWASVADWLIQNSLGALDVGALDASQTIARMNARLILGEFLRAE